MKKLFFLTAVFCLCAVSAFAQEKTAPAKDFSGVWSLDVSKSKLDERARIESMTMTVAQAGKDLKVTTETKRQAPPADAAGGGGGGRGMGGGRGFGDGTNTYSLDGKETTTTRETQMGSIPTKHTASAEGNHVKIASSTTFTTPNGEMTSTSKETWTLSDDGKTLTVERESQSPRGTSSSTMVFAKK